MLDKYLAPGEETWSHIADRVSGIMQNEESRIQVFGAITKKKFIPNSPTLISANKAGGRNLMACHVIHVANSINGILNAAKIAAAIFKSGGGIGFEMSGVSPKGTTLEYTTGGVASGPCSFMKIYDTLASVILEGGLRRAAMMATLNAYHPDIEDFISCKSIDGKLSNFNISVTLDDGPACLNPKVWKLLCQRAYANGEPGVVFLDHINTNNPLLESHGRIIAVNACGEQPLYNFGSCTLGHVVLPNVITKLGEYGELKNMVRLGVRFLNRVIDVNHYPVHEFAQVARDIRNIGLGVMGWSDLLATHNIPFASYDALQLTDEIGEVIYSEARKASQDNSFLTTLAPTGHTSTLAGVENSIYPTYEIGMRMTPDEHLNHVAAWQKHIDSAISYTISFPNDASDSIADHIFRGAYERGIKVMSVYRDGSRKGQPCNMDGDCV